VAGTTRSRPKYDHKVVSRYEQCRPLGPCDSYLRVLKQSKVLGVAMVLNIKLSIRGCEVDVPTPMANAIKTGNFRASL
jgi:hypothetical protein